MSSSSSSSSSSISSSRSLIPRRNNNAVEGEGAGAGATAAAAAAALAALDEWEIDVKQALAKQIWESPLMNEYRDAVNRLMDLTSRQKSALFTFTLVGLSIMNCMIWIAFLRSGEDLEGVFSWTRFAGAACIAAMVLFRFL